MTGISTQSQDGDRIEKPAKTGCSTHGDFSAPMVSPPGTTGDKPAAITRISSGVSAANASGQAARNTTAARPGHRYSTARAAIPPRLRCARADYPSPQPP